MTASQQEGFAQYGADELLAVAELLGASAFPGVDERAVGTSDEARDASLRSARRSLLARGVLEIDDDGVLRITPPHALLFRVALAPAAVVSAEYRRRGRIEGCSYYLLPDVSVEHSAAIGNVHRLDSMETTAVLGRVVEFVDLRDRPSHNGTAFEVPAAALARALESAPERDPDLESSEFGRALGSHVSTSYVRSLHRSGDAVVGGELRWIDTGDSGLWLVEPSGDDAERVGVRPTTSAELLEELLSYLPGAERQPAAT